MENNSLVQIQQKYKDCNLLLPVSTSTQINPFYRLEVMQVNADLTDNSGDIFKVGSIRTGQDSGKDVYEDTFSPAKPLLMKLAAAAGIQFDPNNTYGAYLSKNCYKAKAYGAMRLPDGTFKTHVDEKVINLEDEEDRFRLEFMDKSIEGISDWKAAKAAEKMFPNGEWIDTGENNSKGYAIKKYMIPGKDRQTYIDRSVLVNMTLLRKTFAEKAMTGAILRVIRALVGMKGQYTKAELSKPFAVPRVIFSPDYSDPDVRRSMLEQGLSSMSNMFGSRPMLSDTVHDADYSAVGGMFNPEEFADNPAFTSDGAGMPSPDEEESPSPSLSAEPPNNSGNDGNTAGATECANCHSKISSAVANFSTDKYGAPLCMKCQKEAPQS